MGGDGAAGDGVVDLLHGDQFPYQRLQLFDHGRLDLAGLGDENMTGTDLFAAESFGDVLTVHRAHAAAEFFVYAKLAVLHFQPGFEL